MTLRSPYGAGHLGMNTNRSFNMKFMSIMIALVFSLVCHAQGFFIDLHGLVTEYESGEPIKNALVHVVSSDQTLDMITKKDGSYSVHLKRGSDYYIYFSKKGMITKHVNINAVNVPEQPDVPFYDMDLQMTLFEIIEGVNYSFFEKPVARAEYKHSTRALNWDNEYTKERGREMFAFMQEHKKKKAGYYDISWQKPRMIIFDSLLVLSNDSSDIAVVEKVMEEFVPEDTMTSYYDDQNAAPATQVESVKGLFFTVQVGVYSKPVPLDEIYNITPLNSELMDDGKIRYTSGMFNEMNDAVDYRAKMVRLGVKDAFIVAYFNGKRIPLDDAIYLNEKFGNRLGRQ